MEPPYRAYLEAVLGRVLARDGDLLHPDETARLAAFQGLSLDARHLLVRLLMRKGPWFRLDDLDYPEVGDRAAARAELLAGGWCGAEADGPALAGLLTREELAGWLSTWGVQVPRSARRDALVEAFLAALEDAIHRGQVFVALQPLARLYDDLWALAFLLFFGTFDQDLTVFIRTDLGQLRFEDYPLEPCARRFTARADVDFLRTLRGLREGLEAGSVALEEATRLALGMEARPGVRPQRRFSRLLNELGRAWERRGDAVQALACYGGSTLPPARERRVRILAGQGALEEACAGAMGMAQAPLDASEATFAEAFLRRQVRKAATARDWVEARPPVAPLPERHLELERPAGGTVEDAVLAAARAEGWEGFFAENRLWNALFGLAFWDALFADVPGAFIHPFQSAPLDVSEPGFYEGRKERLEARLTQLREDLRVLLDTARAKWGVANLFVAWRHLEMVQLEAAVDALPVEALCGALETLARHPWARSSGFPDLFLHRPGACALWEVKGPGDTLRPEQDRWLRAFRGWGMEVQIVRVHWA